MEQAQTSELDIDLNKMNLDELMEQQINQGDQIIVEDKEKEQCVNKMDRQLSSHVSDRWYRAPEIILLE